MSADDDLRETLRDALGESMLIGPGMRMRTGHEVADALLSVVRAKLADAWSEALTIAEESANDLDADGHMKNPQVLLGLLEDRVKVWRD